MLALQTAAVILLNLLVLGLIGLVIWFFRRRGPVTESKLRRLVKPDAVPPRDILPCGGDFAPAADLLRVLGLGGGARDLLRAVMAGWVQQGAVCVRTAPKKKLRAFGADVQLELSLAEDAQIADGAAGLLYAELRSWLDADGTLQQSELYQAARSHAQRVDNILRQMTQENRRALRDKGGCMPEAGKAKFGFAEDNRELYTPKGIRLARETAAFVQFVQQNGPGSGQTAVLSALAGQIAPKDPACVLADAIFDGMTAGKQVLN